MTRRQVAGDQWQLIDPFLPMGEYGPSPGRLRDQFEGVIWRFRTGAQWREMPGGFGPWPAVYGRFRIWRNAGVFTALLEGLMLEDLVAEAEQDPRPSAGRPAPHPVVAVVADKAYSSRAHRAPLRECRIKAADPEKKDQAANLKKKGSRGGRPVAFGAGLYRDHNTIERLINRLKDWCGIAPRFDKTPGSYLAGLELRALMIWPGDLLQTAGRSPHRTGPGCAARGRR
ncbi:transposase [Streptomyces sp. NPDC006134]|uniref:transposase n=1 Tax=Streptomyces sp. NPDC006134 TaxID=3154467 RepID=UPI00340AE6E6